MVKFWLNDLVSVTTIMVQQDNVKWFKAQVFAETLGFSDWKLAIKKYISPENCRTFEQIKSANKNHEKNNKKNYDKNNVTVKINLVALDIQSDTIFINDLGVREVCEAIKKPIRKRVKTWSSGETLTNAKPSEFEFKKVKLNNEITFKSDVIKIALEFNNKNVEFVCVTDSNNKKWLIAHPFAYALSYLNATKAILMHVNRSNQASFYQINTAAVSNKSHINVEPKTRFITVNGLIELITNSNLPNISELLDWVTCTLMPKLNVPVIVNTREPSTFFL